MKYWRTITRATLIFLAASEIASATDLFSITSTLAAGDLMRSFPASAPSYGSPSDWSQNKGFFLSLNSSVHYKTFAIAVNGGEYIQVDVKDPTSSVFVSAYLDSFNPNSPSTNYLGDIGSSPTLRGPSRYFQVVIPAGHGTLIVVVNERFNQLGIDKAFSFLVEGFNDTMFTPSGPASSLAPVSVSPNTGAGAGPQTFIAAYSDPAVAGSADINVVYLNFGVTPGASNSCFAAYVRASDTLFLLNDASTGLVPGSISPGSAATLSNSQCTLSGAGGPVIAAGNLLTVPFNVTFAPGFTGLKSVYGLAQNNSGTASPWVTLGSWTTSAVVNAVSVTPTGGGGLGPFTFTARFSDSFTNSDLNFVYLNFGSTPGSANSCTAAYIRSTNALILLNDAGTGLVAGSIVPGGQGTLSNHQCTLSGAGGAAIASGNNLTVPFSVTFIPGFFGGAKSIYGLAQSNGGNNSGYQLLGTWTPEPLILGAASVTPAIGTGSGPQTFTAVFTDPQSFGDMHVVYLDFGSTRFGAGPGSANNCFAAYVRPTNQLFLLDDTSLGLVPGAITPGGPGTLSNSQCTLSGAGGPVTVGGNTMTVPFNITFASRFAGPVSVWGLVLNNANVNRGFQTLGTWTVTAPSLGAASVSPSSGTGLGPQVFNAAFTDPTGAADINAAYLDIATSAGAANSCFVAYVRSSNQLYLLSDTSTALVAGSITPGGPGSLSNSQCMLTGAGGAVTTIGVGLNVPFSITFAAGFSGAKNIYGMLQNNGGTNSTWVTLGAWTPAPLVLGAISVTPSSGGGFGPQTFTAVYTDPSTAGDIHVAYLDFAASPGSGGSCFVAYVPSANQLYLLNDAATGLVAGSITPGAAASLSNSQCTLSGSGGAATSAGNNLTVPFNIAFAAGFNQAKTIYGLVQNNSNVSGGWQTLGTWTP